MSCRPNALGLNDPTGIILSPLTLARERSSSLPQLNNVVVPARQAYSHWASVGSCTCLPVLVASFSQNARASIHDTISTGKLALTALLGLLPASASYCCCVTSNLPM